MLFRSRLRIVRAVLSGELTVSEAARRRGVTNQTVSNILAAAEAKIGFHGTAQATASVRSQQIARLEHVYSEAMAAWRQSQEAKKSASKRTSRGVARGQRSVLATTEHETIAQTVNDRANLSRAAATPTRHKGQHSRKDGTHLTVHIDRLLERLLEVGCQVGPIGCSRWGRIRPQPHVNEVPAGAPGSTRDEHCCTVQYNMTSAYRHTAQGDAGPSPCTRRVAA